MKKSIKIESYRGSYCVRLSGDKSKEGLYKTLEEISSESFLVVDSKIDKLYPEIKTAWDSNRIFLVDAKEENKSLESCNSLISFLIERKIKKNNKIVAVGGGIVQDLVSFSASIIYRGIDWIFVPTTLLSQADSCIGSKTSINFNGVKNLLGTFHPPREIHSFSLFLETLSDDDIKSGIGEILHYYLIYNSKNLKSLNESYEKIFSNRSILLPHVFESLNIKKKMIEVDEFDKNERNIFNYGHTFGHAIEVISNYEISHGRAVTLGMDIANFISYKKSLITIDRYKELRNLIKKNIPEFDIEPGTIKDYISILQKDKKNTKNTIRCILLNDSKAEIYNITSNKKLEEYLIEYFENMECENV